MPEIAPFQAIRYDHQRLGRDLTSVIAPPYDVLDEADKDALLERSKHNIVAVDLPHVPPKSLGPEAAYEKAARLLRGWIDEGVLVQESQPALYLYHQKFEHEGRTHTRRMFFARVRLASFAENKVIPHEKTFGGPKEDRLALMKATGCQLSPIFGLFADADDQVGKAFADAAACEPDVTAHLDGVENRLWIVTDKSAIKSVTKTLADERIYIADGHHRYSTALNYRDWATKEAGGQLPKDHPANYIMFVLASMDDPGCLILPYHRAVAGASLKKITKAWEEGAAPTSREDADLTVWDAATEKEAHLRFTNRERLMALEPDQCAPWYALDYAYLHRYLIDELLQDALNKEPEIGYAKSADAARAYARDHKGAALFVNATPLAHLRAVSDAGGLMPQKSTYFFPKLATGLAMNPLE